MNQKQNELDGERGRETRHPLGWCFLVLLLIVTCPGCKRETAGGGESKKAVPAAGEINAVGTYNLTTVDGQKVPCTVQHEGHTMTISSGGFVIGADGTCSSKMVLAGFDRAIEVKATYTREGKQLTMKWQGAGMTLGTVEGDTFTMNNEGMVFAYRK